MTSQHLWEEERGRQVEFRFGGSVMFCCPQTQRFDLFVFTELKRINTAYLCEAQPPDWPSSRLLNPHVFMLAPTETAEE